MAVEPPATSRNEASFAIVLSSLEAKAINTIIEREGASAARVVVDRERWHKVGGEDEEGWRREVEVTLFSQPAGWDERTYRVRANGHWQHDGLQGVWRDP